GWRQAVGVVESGEREGNRRSGIAGVVASRDLSRPAGRSVGEGRGGGSQVAAVAAGAAGGDADVELADGPPAARACLADEPDEAGGGPRQREGHDPRMALTAGDRGPGRPVGGDLHLVAAHVVAGTRTDVERNLAEGGRGAKVDLDPVA